MSDQETAAAESSAAPQSAGVERILDLLRNGRLTVEGLMPNASNYTFLVTIKQPDLSCLAIYKPQRGERPLWDFARGTLCLREYAAFLTSMSLGWLLVPPTVLRRGPHGLGAVQLFIDAAPDANFFTLRAAHGPVFQRLCAFDYVVNNADRKGGHCLLGRDGRIWAIDHGITFHAEFKLRTVIWDWAGEPLPEDIVGDLRGLQEALQPHGNLAKVLGRLLAPSEMAALRARLETLLADGAFPEPDPDRRNVPWPLL